MTFEHFEQIYQGRRRPGIDLGRVHLTLELPQQLAVAFAMLTGQDHFGAGRAKGTRHRCDGGGFTLVDVGHITGVMDQFSSSTAWAFYGVSSLEETNIRPSMTDSLKYTSALLAVLALYTSCQIRTGERLFLFSETTPLNLPELYD